MLLFGLVILAPLFFVSRIPLSSFRLDLSVLAPLFFVSRIILSSSRLDLSVFFNKRQWFRYCPGFLQCWHVGLGLSALVFVECWLTASFCNSSVAPNHLALFPCLGVWHFILTCQSPNWPDSLIFPAVVEFSHLWLVRWWHGKLFQMYLLQVFVVN